MNPVPRSSLILVLPVLLACAAYGDPAADQSAHASTEDGLVHVRIHRDDPKLLQGSVSFAVEADFDLVKSNMETPGTLGRITSYIDKNPVTKEPFYFVKKTQDDKDARTYAIRAKIAGVNTIFATGSAFVNLKIIVNKHALAKRLLVVDFQLDRSSDAKGEPTLWEKLDGHIYGADDGAGWMHFLVTTSSKGKDITLPQEVRLQMARTVLQKTRKDFIRWLVEIKKLRSGAAPDSVRILGQGAG